MWRGFIAPAILVIAAGIFFVFTILSVNASRAPSTELFDMGRLDNTYRQP